MSAIQLQSLLSFFVAVLLTLIPVCLASTLSLPRFSGKPYLSKAAPSARCGLLLDGTGSPATFLQTVANFTGVGCTLAFRYCRASSDLATLHRKLVAKLIPNSHWRIVRAEDEVGGGSEKDTVLGTRFSTVENVPTSRDMTAV